MVVFALAVFLVLKNAGLFDPPAIERWGLARLKNQLKVRPTFADQWREALRKLTPSRMEGMREMLAPIDYENLRRRAAIELGVRGPSASNAVDVLVSAIGQENSLDAAHEEFMALGRIGPAARQAVPRLLEWLAKPDPAPAPWTGTGIWKQGAAWALVRIAPEDPRVADALISALASCGIERSNAFLSATEFTELGDPDTPGHGWPSTRRSLIRAIGKLRPQTPQTLAALFHELRYGDYAAEVTAADVLGEIRPAFPDTIAALKDALLRTEAEHLPDRRDLVALTPPYLDSAHAALFKVDPSPEMAMVFRVPTSPIEQLETIYLPGAGFPGWGLRLRVIRALGRIGSPAREVFPLLVQECESQTRPWRFDAAVAAWRISGDSPEAITTFERGLHYGDLESRQFAVARLSEIGTEFPKALGLLASGLRDSSVQIRFLALGLVAALGTNAIPVLPAIIDAMTNDRTFRIRIAATQTLQAVQAPILSKGNP